MELKMKIGKEVVDQVVLNPGKIKDADYLSGIKNSLYDKHQRLITQSHKKPMFYIEVKSGA